MSADYTHFVLDLDGTLVDSIPGIDAAARAGLAQVAPGEKPPSLRAFIGPPIRTMLQQALGWTEAARLDPLEQAFRRHYDGGAWRETMAYPGVNDTLRALRARGARLHVLTNKPQAPTARIMDHLGWTGLMDAIVTPQSRQPPYPDKAAAAVDLRDRLGLPAVATLLVRFARRPRGGPRRRVFLRRSGLGLRHRRHTGARLQARHLCRRPLSLAAVNAL